MTKIIATLGPASSEPDALRALIEAGAGVFRLNFSHGTLDGHSERLRMIRSVAAEFERPICVFGDLQGPKIRIAAVENDCIEVETGSTVIFQREDHVTTFDDRPLRFSTTYPAMIDDVERGQRVLIDDGAVRMLAFDKKDDELHCTVTHGGPVRTGKGVNLPESTLSLSSISEKDIECVRWAVEHDADFLALSFVTSAADIHELQELLGRVKAECNRESIRMPIVAKIERPAAVDAMESIIEAADGIMVARGDLGVEMDLARVPVVQKRLIEAAHDYGKPCIVATQMLQSMIDSPIPTRAEASDVANAIFDGADAVMLSGETAVGRYPAVVVETMRRIAESAESYLRTLAPENRPPMKLQQSADRTAALAHGAWTVAQDKRAKFIVVWSQQGGGARYLSKNNFRIPIIAVSTDRRALRQMQLLGGVFPVRMERPADLGAFTRAADAWLLSSGWADPGDPFILLAGNPIGQVRATNSLAIHRVGDSGGE